MRSDIILISFLYHPPLIKSSVKSLNICNEPDPAPTPDPAYDDTDDDDDADRPAVTPARPDANGGSNSGNGGSNTVRTAAATGRAAVAPATPAAENIEAEVADNTVPKADTNAVSDIVDEETPLAGVWALINLIAAILTLAGGVIALFRRKEQEDGQNDAAKAEAEDENDSRSRKMFAAKAAGALAAIAAPIAFILTEDMSLPMVMADRWTVLMIVILAVQIVAAALNKKASKLEDNEEELAAEGAN